MEVSTAMQVNSLSVDAKNDYPAIAIVSSEGIQVGSVRSAYGVLGMWTTVDHDGSDPVGELSIYT